MPLGALRGVVKNPNGKGEEDGGAELRRDEGGAFC